MATQAKLTKKQAVQKLITQINKYIKRWKDAEAEITIGLIELEKLNAHEAIDIYSTFAEMIEGEFGWTEIRFRSAKAMMKQFGATLLKEYGRETLVAISRTGTKNQQKKVFDRINEYKLKKGGKVPSYRSVNKWVNDVMGTVPDNGTPTKVVDIKKKYLETLEQNKSLHHQVVELQSEVARLNNFIRNPKGASTILRKHQEQRMNTGGASS